MKKFYSLLAVVAMTTVMNAQATVASSLYEETFGSFGSASTTFTASTMSSYDKTGTTTLEEEDVTSLTFAGANAMYATSTATNMTSGHVWLNKNTTGNFVVSNIPIYNATKIKVTFSQAGVGNIDVYADFGNGETKVGGSTAAGATIEIPAFATAGTTLNLKFQRQSNNNNLRIDNIKVIVTEIATMAVVDATKTKANLVKNTIVSNELIFGAAAKVSVYNAAGQVVKTAEVAENSKLDVSALAKGTYIVAGVVNGQTVSQKIIKK